MCFDVFCGGCGDREVDDTELLGRLNKQWENREILILAPGASISGEKEIIHQFIAEENPLVISANFLPESYHYALQCVGR